MRVTIIGYGRMGHEIERILTERNHTVHCTVDPMPGIADHVKLSADALKESDGVIEFSGNDGGGVLGNAELYAKAGVPAVVGTTGWDRDFEKVKTLINTAGGTYLWGSNFSIGAHVFFSLAEKAASLVNNLPEYDIMGFEIHHNRKKDSPSGTALSTAQKIINASNRKTTIVTEKLDRAIKPEELHFASLRGGSVPGVHTVYLDSPADTIEISHTARNRQGLALGAVMALEWVKGKQGFFLVEDFVRDIFLER